MNEERIKERCKREDIALKVVKGFLEKDCYTDTELNYSLNTLLDLYNKQKQEAEHYKAENSIRNKCLFNIAEKVGITKNGITESMIINAIDNNYISKDKIRNKIKELEEKEKNCHFTGLITECEIKIEVLNEILEEK